MSANVIVIEFAPQPAKKKRPHRTVAKVKKKSEQELLLAQLRRESKIRCGPNWRKITKGSALYDLAQAAMYAQKRHITWRGIKFPIFHGLWLQVIDPETGKVLVQTSGGIL